VLSIDQLKDIVSGYALDASRLALKWKDQTRLIDFIVTTVRGRTEKGTDQKRAPRSRSEELRACGGLLRPRQLPPRPQTPQLLVSHRGNVGLKSSRLFSARALLAGGLEFQFFWRARP